MSSLTPFASVSPAPGNAPPGETAAARDGRPVFAIVANTQAPYRLHLHGRVARELTEVQLFSLFTLWNHPDAQWAPRSPPEINPVLFADAPPPRGAVRNNLFEWRKGGAIVRWLRRNDARAVLVNGYSDLGRLRVIRWCARRGVPCLLWGDSNIRGDRAAGLKAWAKRRLVGWVLRRCAAVLPCGTNGIAFFSKYGARPERMFRFPLEPDYAQIDRLTAEQVRVAADRFGLPPGRRRLVFSGRLIPLKRVDLLVDAFAAVAGRRPQWDLLVVGDGPLRAELESRVPEPLRGRVFWTGFLEDQETISALYRASDVLALTSNRDAWALVINEAAAAGLAIVCSDVVGAAADLVRDGVNGRLFASENLASLTESLLDVTDPAKTDAMKAASGAVLADWRREADPVEGLRQALARSA